VGVEGMTTKVLYVRVDEEVYQQIKDKCDKESRSMAVVANRLLALAIQLENKYELKWVEKE
jgi:hypothetical protein